MSKVLMILDQIQAGAGGKEKSDLPPAGKSLPLGPGVMMEPFLNDLKIADLSREYSVHKDSFEEELSVLVQRNLSKGNGEEDYVFPQFVAAYCKKLGYDGIGYRSKYASKYDTQNGFGINYSIFNYDKCKAISSILMKVREMNVDISEYNMFKR